MGVVVLGKKRAYIKNDQKKCPKRYHELLGLFDFISCVLLHEKPLILMGKIEIFESRNYQDLPYAWIRHYFTRD
jgi:hypothetical protein